jgi:hypothetical protein
MQIGPWSPGGREMGLFQYRYVDDQLSIFGDRVKSAPFFVVAATCDFESRDGTTYRISHSTKPTPWKETRKKVNADGYF